MVSASAIVSLEANTACVSAQKLLNSCLLVPMSLDLMRPNLGWPYFVLSSTSPFGLDVWRTSGTLPDNESCRTTSTTQEQLLQAHLCCRVEMLHALGQFVRCVSCVFDQRSRPFATVTNKLGQSQRSCGNGGRVVLPTISCETELPCDRGDQRISMRVNVEVFSSFDLTTTTTTTTMW